MQDKIDLELKRLLTDSGASEDFWQQVEIWQREADETEDSATDGETDAELQRQIELWQRDDEENEPARLEAEARAASDLDEFLDRLRNDSDL